MSIPDSVNSDDIKKLLDNGRGILPQVRFSRTEPAELTFLVGMFLGNDGTRSPEDAPHVGAILHTSASLLASFTGAMKQILPRRGAEMTAKLVMERPDKDEAIDLVTTISREARFYEALDTVHVLMEALITQSSHIFQMSYDQKVSDKFLESLGMSRETFERLRDRTSTPIYPNHPDFVQEGDDGRQGFGDSTPSKD